MSTSIATDEPHFCTLHVNRRKRSLWTNFIPMENYLYQQIL